MIFWVPGEGSKFSVPGNCSGN